MKNELENQVAIFKEEELKPESTIANFATVLGNYMII